MDAAVKRGCLFLGAQGSLEAASSDVPPLAHIYKSRVPTGLAAESDLAGPAEGQRGTSSIDMYNNDVGKKFMK
jgi:hypothetical protein